MTAFVRLFDFAFDFDCSIYFVTPRRKCAIAFFAPCPLYMVVSFVEIRNVMNDIRFIFANC